MTDFVLGSNMFERKMEPGREFKVRRIAELNTRIQALHPEKKALNLKLNPTHC
jgi:hypothetical protein